MKHEPGSAAVTVLPEPSPVRTDEPLSPPPASPGSLRARAEAVLCRLGSSPVHLFLALLAVNALALPYAGFVHDARFYGFQVLNRVEAGRFADDLFFRHGSQDRYSLFSPVAAPLTAVLGLPLSFFLLYLIGNGLFLLALQRLVLALVPDRRAAVLALLFLAVTPIPYGGLGIFHVNENFLTPRVLANALVLFGLERLYRGRLGVALGLLLVALLLHPLMALGGLLVYLGWCLVTFGSRALVAGVVSVLGVAGAVVVLVQPLGLRVFGLMDDAWRACVLSDTAYNFPAEWTLDDWLRLLGAFAIGLGAWRHFRGDPVKQRILAVLLPVALLGLFGTILAGELPYALLLQGQPYRAIWILQLLQVPLGFLLAQRWWSGGSSPGRAGAAILIGYLMASAATRWQICLLLFLFAFPICALLRHGLRLPPRNSDWFWQGAVGSVVVTLVLWVAAKITFNLVNWNPDSSHFDPLAAAQQWLFAFDPFHRLVLGAGYLLLLYRFLADHRFVVFTVGPCLLLQLVAFAAPPLAADNFNADDVAFVRTFLQARFPERERPPTVYWPYRRVDVIWFRLGVNSYYQVDQFVGGLFSRATALEGQHRLSIVRPFEVEQANRATPLEGMKLNEAPPSRADFDRLCYEKGLDVAVLEQRFDGLYAATNGRWYIYDCRQLRAGGLERAAVPAGMNGFSAADIDFYGNTALPNGGRLSERQ